MFVFKAGVLGAGTMGGEIAQVIASADVPVAMKDVKQDLVDAGPREGARGDRGPAREPGRQGEDHLEQAEAPAEEILGLITGTTEYDGFGDVDFVIEAVPERMEIKQAVFAELDEVTRDTRSSRRTPRRSRSPRSARPPPGPRRWSDSTSSTRHR